jgi:hypothetical protein
MSSKIYVEIGYDLNHNIFQLSDQVGLGQEYVM